MESNMTNCISGAFCHVELPQHWPQAKGQLRSQGMGGSCFGGRHSKAEPLTPSGWNHQCANRAVGNQHILAIDDELSGNFRVRAKIVDSDLRRKPRIVHHGSEIPIPRLPFTGQYYRLPPFHNTPAHYDVQRCASLRTPGRYHQPTHFHRRLRHPILENLHEPRKHIDSQHRPPNTAQAPGTCDLSPSSYR